MTRNRATPGRLKALLSRIAATFLGALVWVGAPTCLTYQGVTGIWNTHQLHTRAVSAPQPGRVVSRSLGRSPFVTVVFTTRTGDSVSTNIHSWPDGQPDVGDTIPVSYLPEHPDVAEDTQAPAGYGIPIFALAGGLAFIGVSLGLLRRSLQGRRTPGRRDSVR